MVEVGQLAPEFALKDQNNQVVSLADFRGVKNVVLVFYPLSFTGVCEGELCALRDGIEDFSGDDVVTLAVSCDSTAVHKRWADEQGFTFPLLADFWPHGEVARQYGVLDEKIGLALRGTFIVDKQGKVAY
ncbi:MAG: mycoredoxin-dependent peroxiredoxin, partial [Frankiaceae bacterium]|nr:mycoredoxin-dependent peroxiredoxin [Frankiaceae bacterium]